MKQADPYSLLSSYQPFQRLLVVRLLRPDKLIPSIQMMITELLDKFFIEQPYFDLSGVLEDSSPVKPLIFVLSTGADPRQEVENLAKRKDMKSRLVIKSMGQGQGESVTQTIKEG